MYCSFRSAMFKRTLNFATPATVVFTSTPFLSYLFSVLLEPYRARFAILAQLIDAPLHTLSA